MFVAIFRFVKTPSPGMAGFGASEPVLPAEAGAKTARSVGISLPKVREIDRAHPSEESERRQHLPVEEPEGPATRSEASQEDAKTPDRRVRKDKRLCGCRRGGAQNCVEEPKFNDDGNWW